MRTFCFVVFLIAMYDPDRHFALAEGGGGSGDNNSSETVQSGDLPSQRPIDRGLKPLYVMSDTFLDLVQPAQRGFVLDDPRFDGVYTAKHLSTGLTVVVNATNDWQYFANHYIGYLSCLAFGAFFMIVMPLIGLIIWCCRCCGHCGGKRRYRVNDRREKCRRATCGIFLLLFTTLITAGVVCAFVTNQLLHDLTKSQSTTTTVSRQQSYSDAGLVTTALLTLDSLQNYQQSTVQELNSGIVPLVRTSVDSLLTQLIGFPVQMRRYLSDLISFKQLIAAAEALNSSAVELQQTLHLVVNYTHTLQSLQQGLNASLLSVREHILKSLNCSVVINSDAKRRCNNVAQQVQILGIGSIFDQFQDLSNQLDHIKSAVDGDLVPNIEKALSSVHNMSTTVLVDIENTARGHIAEAVSVVNSTGRNIVNQLQSYVNSVVSAIETVNVTVAAQYIQTDVDPVVEQYGNYRYYVGIGLGCMLLIIVTLIYLGLCFGACGETAGDDAQACNRGIGANLLLSGVGFIFIFGWMLMAVVTILFVIGGLPQTELCRPITEPSPTFSGFYKAVDWMLSTPLKESGYNVNLSYLSIMSECQTNEGIYSSLSLDNVFNLTGRSSEMKVELNSSLNNAVSSIDVNITKGVNFLPREVQQLFDSLLNSGVDNINFTSFDVILAYPIVTVDVSGLVSQLVDIANVFPQNSTEQLAILRQADILRSIQATQVSAVTDYIEKLRSSLVTLQYEVQPHANGVGFTNQTQQLVDIITSMQQMVLTNGTAAVKTFVVNFAAGLYDSVVSTLSKVLYQNGFWFSIGWCLAFCIPTLIIAMRLASLYRTIDEFGIADSKSFDEAVYDAYSGDISADDIPLDDLRRKRSRVHPAANGHNNTVYEPDINPPPPATLYGPYAGVDGMYPRTTAMPGRNFNSPQDFGYVRTPFHGGQLQGPAGGSRPARLAPRSQYPSSR